MPCIDIDGARLHVVTRGPSFEAVSGAGAGAAPAATAPATILFLHGLGSSAADWVHQIERFGTDADVVAPDFRNHGESSKGHGGLPLERLAADTVAVMDALGVERAHVVGLSMGGCVALQLALDAPGRVRTLTLANSGADMRPRGMRVRLLMALRRPLFALAGMQRIGRMQAERLFPDPRDAASKAVSLRSWNRVSKRDFLAQFGIVLGWHREHRLDGIGVPVLVLGAQEDFTPMAWKRTLADRLPDARLVEIDGHHMAPLEKPGSFDAALDAFLEARDTRWRPGAGATAPPAR